MGDVQTWRVVLAPRTPDGAAEERQLSVAWVERFGGARTCDGHGYHRSPRRAAMMGAFALDYDVAEILAPGEPTRAELAAELAAERDHAREALTEARRVLHFARAVVDAWDTASADGDGPDVDRVEDAIRQLADEAGDWSLTGPLSTTDALAAERDAARDERDAARVQRDAAWAQGAEAMREACFDAVCSVAGFCDDQLARLAAIRALPVPPRPEGQR